MQQQIVSEESVFDAIFDMTATEARRADMDRPPKLPLGDAIRAAAAETGSGTAWLSGFWRTVSGPGKLSAAEYFYYKLYAANRTEDALLRFVGKDMQSKMHVACNDVRWFAPSTDKLFFLSAMLGAGVPVPKTLAVLDPTHRRSHPCLITGIDAMTAFLDCPESYPLFAKPIDGMYSLGTVALTDGGEGQAHVRGAGNLSTREIAENLFRMGKAGYLLQRTMLPDTHIADVFGSTLASVRFLVLVGDDGPVIESAVVKIPRSDNIADNFWRPGNMVGAVNMETGCITRVIQGTGSALSEISHHPETGHQLVGFRLPDWRAAAQMCVRAAGTLPGLRTQSWDVALTSKGPVALEVNWGGDLNLHQLAHDRGALTPTFTAHLRRNGYKGKLPAE